MRRKFSTRQKNGLFANSRHQTGAMRINRLLTAIILPAILCAAALLTGGCASTIQYPPFPDQAKRIDDPAKARVYVIRPAHFFGAAGVIRFGATTPEAGGPRMAGKYRIVGEIAGGGYICWETPPTALELYRSENKPESKFTLNLDAGTVYYLRLGTRPGLSEGHAVLKVISEEEGQSLLKKCKPPAGLTKKSVP
jgi:hypothetical protein